MYIGWPNYVYWVAKLCILGGQIMYTGWPNYVAKFDAMILTQGCDSNINTKTNRHANRVRISSFTPLDV